MIQKKVFKPVSNISTTASVVQELQEQPFHTDIGIGGCFIKHLGGLLEQVDAQLFDEDADRIKINGEDVLPFFKLMWATVKQAMLDCKGKDLQIQDIDLGDSQAANFTEAALKLLLIQFLNED